ncbi:MAG TPA: hypothetical protein VMM79_15620 [Longimicrobiales bacterium]|nr:hypothetical protein [Longimicrobiales bacterium]
MSQDVETIKAMEPGHYDLEAHASRVARLRQTMTAHMMLKRPDLYHLFLAEMAATFSRRELEWIVEAFSGFAPVEIATGQVIPEVRRRQQLNGYAPRSSADEQLMRFFLTPREIQFTRNLWQSVKRTEGPKLGVPTPIAVIFGVPFYRTEGPRDQLVRQLGEGEYLFGDLGGLTGGFAFVVSRDVLGHSHDQAVKHGAFFATFGEALGALSAGVEQSSKVKALRPVRPAHTPSNPRRLGGPTPLQPAGHRAAAPQRGDVLRVVPALPSPSTMGPDGHKSMVQLLKTLNASRR